MYKFAVKVLKKYKETNFESAYKQGQICIPFKNK